MRMVLSTLPREKEFVNWATPEIASPSEVKYMPLGLISLAGNNTASADIVVLDPDAEGWDIDTTVEKINMERADVVGFSAVTRRTYALYELLRRVQTVNDPYQGFKIVGGPHTTHHAEELLKAGADAVFVGNLADHDLMRWCEAPKRGVIIQCQTKINEISHPRRKILDYEKYFYTGKVFFKSEKRMHVFSSVGCPNTCNFCTVQTHKVQRKRADLLLGELWHCASLGAASIHFMDDAVNTSNQHVTSILNEMEATGWKLPWSIRGQVKFDLSLVPRMKKNGLNRIHVGIESFDDETLKWFHKNHRMADTEKFCQVMRENDIEVLAYMIIGTPLDTEESLKSMPDTMRRLGIKHPYVNILYPFPNTIFYDNLLKDGIYKVDHWKKFFENPVPNYEIPAPYGEEKKNKAIATAERIIKEFQGI